MCKIVISTVKSNKLNKIESYTQIIYMERKREIKRMECLRDY